MKLSPEQENEFDQLFAQLRAAAFGDTERSLEAIAREPSPALIPALLPALVRGKAHEQTFLHRVRQTLMPSANSGSEDDFRQKLAALLARCLALADASELFELDDACRGYSTPRWLTNDWRSLDASAIESHLPTAHDSRLAFLAVASFHGSGYVRERAVELLAAETSGAELPFLLLRLNDWVNPVQRRAFQAVHARIRDDYAQHFARWFELVLRLRDASRNQLTDIVRWALTLLTTPVGWPHLAALFGDKNRRMRRSAFQLACAGCSNDVRRELLRRALRDSDVGTRQWAARAAFDHGLWFDEMGTDPCGSIRGWLLRARVERDQTAAIPALRNALFDTSASVRASARFHLSRLEPTLNVADLYRTAFEQHDDGLARAVAISGLAEVGTRDDAVMISFLTSSASNAVAKAALHACARLAPQDSIRELMEALNDSRASVSKAAKIALAGAACSAARLSELVRDAVYTHTRLNALELFRNQGRWDWLIGVLDALQNDRAEVRDAARVATERWLSVLSLSVYRPAPASSTQLEQLRTKLPRITDGALRKRVQQVIEESARTAI